MIDTHAHLNYFDDLDSLVEKMSEDGLDYIVNIGTTVKDSIQGVELANKYEKVYTTVGIYPEYSLDVTKNDLDTIKDLAKNEKVVAIGEIGLDYHREDYDKITQREILIKQLEIADEMGIPFCIHCRGAVQDLYEILSSHKHLINHSGLMHCYSEGTKWAMKFVELGLYISLAGNITYKKSDREFLKDLPLDRILFETDSPYLSPEPLRGRKNEPKNVRVTMERVAKEIGISSEELEKISTENARRFYFRIK
ncbi:MAG: TatD family deoxyribonuclease [Clostridiales bacterium]|nr:TatD family deoxyribonuclease [Clostridiales bacterium]